MRRTRTQPALHRTRRSRGARAAAIALLLSLALSPTVVRAAQAGPSAAPSPIAIVDDEGTTVTIPEPPQRIVSLTPGTTEILFAIGAGDRVVATTDADDYPPEAIPLPDVGSFGTVDLEAIVGLDADLVVAGGNGYTPPDAIERLRDVGIPVVVVYAPTTDAIAGDVELLAQVTGSEAEGTAVADTLRDELAGLTAVVAELPRPRVFYEVDATAEIYGPADDSFLAEMVELAGGTPITSGSSMSFEIPLERLVVEDPEVIVLGDANYGTTPEIVAGRPGWGDITAVREGAIRPIVEDILVTRPGPRLPEGLAALIEAIHPDALP